MAVPVDMLVGEKLLGSYTVVVLEHLAQGWQPTVMPLNAIVTNYRLTLKPYKKKYQPATLPSHFMRRVMLTTRGGYNCIELTVRTEHALYLMLSTGRLDDLYHDLNAMVTPPPRFRFDDKVAQEDIKRLVQFLEKQREPINPIND
ncbi:hypothetical protein G4Y79_23940 [Phototrophicus methaneseepsis]|uniref:Uncharacterized protein n=1 Tax=Phototrophicus methaneseepsis TaxID=2710758 RepID=A0A7S8E957_9CHLR|nr:hypothetical protein [Phototrophicus methaneseepsis]QPC82698.1 hypothetical protein G4Y79_23940 [Phototrophicus methaneseepsis]